MPPLFKSEQGKREILKLYDQKLESLGIAYDELSVQTSLGKTHVIATGDPSQPPLIIVHGSNACAPISLETYPNLSKSFRVFAVDVPAQPNKSEENRPSMKDGSYGQWLNEVMDSLQLKNVTLVGFSFGGLVILKTLEVDASKVKEVFLAAPAYIVNGNPIKALFRVFIPMRRYMKKKDIKYVERFLSNLFTDRDEFAIQYLAKVFLAFKMDFTPVPVIKTQASKAITTPISIFAAQQDVIFPGSKMMKRAKRIFPSLKYTTLLENSKHVQNKSQNEMIEQVILQE